MTRSSIARQAIAKQSAERGLYAAGLTLRDIQAHLLYLYGLKVSPDLISRVTDAVLDEVREWQSRALDRMYPIVLFDALRVKIRDADSRTVKNKAVYVALGVTRDGQRKVLGLWLAENEGAKFWLSVMNELKNRGMQDILIAVVDGLKGFPEAITAQPGLPLKKGRAATMTHDYKRYGTTTLFAALDVKSGKVIGDCMPRHRAREFLKFLRRIDRDVPKSREVHLVLDNYATHKTPEVTPWLAKHPRFHLHFTPTSASWLNLVERFFAEITSRRIRRGSYTSVGELEAAIYDYFLQHNAKPKPFAWTKSAEDILARERRALNALDEIRGNR